MTTAADLTTATWRKSSYSNGDGGNCVEVADGAPDLAPVRDSKITDGPVLVFRAAGWMSFIKGVKSRAF
ncbi:DUF397 domain-containing protein [Streptomyces sp. NBC_00841]|uniref:DUF397 domain-containing protein n=1 Tax=unclassified Streptomyces TaxID=2593676 RepID=UPI002254E341|nr:MULTISPECIES: DUF397 domain-containing protein [unclassified Streptomyces]MCX4531906.1 DUF397 domain-containing protein [Streptomyces sp. NBC_01669]WSA02541.1 DUF397 domain-containing protein [Streptomyces sp. NBC_00841]